MSFEPQYTLSPALLSHIAAIERLYGQLEGMRIPESLVLNLERKNLTTSAYISNSIEGNPLSLPEVTNLLLDGRIPVNRDEKEVRNYFEILTDLPVLAKRPLDRTAILSMHNRLLTGVQDDIAGRIRNEKVVVGRYDQEGTLHVRHEPPTHQQNELEHELDALLAWLPRAQVSPVLRAGLFHHHFVFLHPFADGNGRLGRLATSCILLRHRYRINKYFVLDDYYDVDRAQYADKLSSADRGDSTAWLEYFTEGMVYSLQSALGRIRSGLDQLNFSSRPSPREKDVLALFQAQKEVTSQDIVGQLHISRQQAHLLLQSLMEKGFLEKHGKTKASYYTLK